MNAKNGLNCLQGDVVALVDGTGAKVVEYSYDAWGKPTSKTGTMAGMPAEEEIRLWIQLDLEEDIGLLILDIDYDGVRTSGGISNANRSMLRHDERLDWSLDRLSYSGAADTGELTLRFRIVTEYCDPNFDNVYPEELTVALDPVTFPAAFGGSYSLTITGGRAHGWQAVLDQP